MRAILVGIVCFLGASAALAQATGDVESIGFDHSYRPGCWTPMVVRLTPTTGSPFEGKIAVYEDDPDHDHVIFTRPVSLTGNAEGVGGERTQRFWMYFIPGADLSRDGTDSVAINRRLQVFLTTKDGKQITRLPVRDALTELDHNDQARSAKLMLCVVDVSKPILTPYHSPGTIGTKEDLVPVLIPIGNVRSLLPESVLGYESVDAVAWFDADPGQLSDKQRTALEEYVRRGGKLVVSQTTKPNQWEMVRRSFANLLPVDVTGIDKVNDLAALRRIVDAGAEHMYHRELYAPKWKDLPKGPFDYAVAKVKPGAVVAEAEQPAVSSRDKPQYGRPYLVRWAFGAGTVTWVAQDLGDPLLTGRSGTLVAAAGGEDYKWMWIWDRVMGWYDVSQIDPGSKDTFTARDKFAGRDDVYHLGRSFLGGMEFPQTGAAYLGLAILFFIAYWVLAGPASYLYLAGKKKPGNSWWAFALAALIATGVTVIIVKLVLRGSAQVHHVTFVRQTPGELSRVHTLFGLYIPKDGGQKVELMKTDPNAASYVTAYPSLSISDEGAPPIEYEVPVFDAKAVTFPYRSTLKKLQAEWVGDLPQGVEGAGRLLEAGVEGKWIEGKLTNKTGRKLKNVYVAFRTGSAELGTIDQMLYRPTWDADETIDLNADFKAAKTFSSISSVKPGQDVAVRSYLQQDPFGPVQGAWESFWYHRFPGDKGFDDEYGAPGSFAMLSLYDRLSPVQRDTAQGSRFDRWELHRPAMHDLDVSGDLLAGKLIVLAQTADKTGKLPVPIQVDGDEVGGEGTTYYQFILPLDRSAVPPPPATLPAATDDKPADKQPADNRPKPGGKT